MFKKDLVILGSYPSSEKIKNILKNCILSLNKDFDIMLCTHYPADSDIQNEVKYYIYDYRNEMIFNQDIYIWSDCEKFYFQGYIDGTSTHPGFAIYRSILNGLKLAKDYYENFYYIEADAVFSKSDINKIFDLKEKVVFNNKKGWFFKLDGVLNSNIFYSNIDFFLSNFTECKNTDEYNSMCSKIGSFGLLENFLYKNIEYNNNLDKLFLIENIHFTEYFKDSKMSLNTYREDGMTHPFELRLVKVENSNKIAYVYVNDNHLDTNDTINFEINGILSKKLPLKRHYESEIIDSNQDFFLLKVAEYTKKYTKEEIFNSKSFVRFK